MRLYVTPRNLVFGAALALLALGVLVAWRLTGATVNPAAVRATLADLGMWGPAALILVLAALLVIPVFPASALQIGAGLAFGPWVGLVSVTLADILGASAGFCIARRWGRPVVDRRLSPDTRAVLDRLTRRMDWRGVILLRLIPGPAYPLVSLAAGYSPLGYRRYLLSSLAGVLPGLALLVLAGDLAQGSPLLAAAIVVLLVLSLIVAGRFLSDRSQ